VSRAPRRSRSARWPKASVSIAASTLLVGAAGIATAQIAIPVDIDDLVRALLSRRGDTTRSARMTLRDERGGSAAALELGAGPSDQIVAIFSFGRSEREIYVHTVRFEDAAGRVVRPRIVDHRPLSTSSSGELVVAQLPDGELDWLADASGMHVTLEGWDQSFAAMLDDRSLRKIRAFRDRRQQSTP
jgi:hypothetical protein